MLDLTIDGADEIDPNLDLIKGLGGALTREKIIAQNSKRLVIIADSSKSVTKLGTHAPLPVEVLPFAHETHEAFFRSLGAEPTLRCVGGMILNTDNGNLIYDLKFKQIDDPVELEVRLHRRGDRWNRSFSGDGQHGSDRRRQIRNAPRPQVKSHSGGPQNGPGSRCIACKLLIDGGSRYRTKPGLNVSLNKVSRPGVSVISCERGL